MNVISKLIAVALGSAMSSFAIVTSPASRIFEPEPAKVYAWEYR